MYKYYFHIIDNEFNSEYDYEGYFDDHEEVEPFIQDNEKVGNIVTIIAPYYKYVDKADCPSCYL